MHALGLPCLLLLLLTPQDPGRADLPDQGPPLRERLIGRAVTPDGKAWAGARVVLVHRPIPDVVVLGQPDRVEVQAADNGRFRAELLHGRSYMAWAEQVDEDGKTRVSDVVEGVFAGETLKLEQGAAPVAPVTCKVSGLEAWAEAKMPEGSYRALLGPQSMILDLGKTDGVTELHLPPHPFDRVVLERLDAAGKVLAAMTLAKPTLPLMPTTWALPKPRRLRIEVRGPNGPIAGAEVWAQVHLEHLAWDKSSGDLGLWRKVLERTKISTWAPFGRSDADGLVDCQVPSPGGKHDLIVRADGFLEHSLELDFATAERAVPGTGPAKQEQEKKEGGKDGEKQVDPEAAKKLVEGLKNLFGGKTAQQDGEEGDADRVVLEPGGKLQGRLMLGEDKPAAGLPFVLLREGRMKSGKHGSRQYDVPAELHVAGQDGSFSFGYLPPETNYRLLTVLTPELWKALGPAYGKVPLPAAELVVVQGSVDKDGKDLGALRLDKLVCVHATIHAARGEREASARLLLKDTREEASVIFQGPKTMVREFDPRGEVAFLLPPGNYDTLVVHPERGVSTEPLGFKPEDSPGTLFEWEVKLDPFAAIDIVVTDGKGGPAAGAHLDMGGGGYTHLSKLCSEIYEWNEQTIERTVVDEQGRGVLRLIPVKAQSYQVSARAGGGHGGSSTQVQISTDSFPEKLELEVTN
ncbi:MAG: hypothetical protein R3F30_09100 [Planctomycetota bacterium]